MPSESRGPSSEKKERKKKEPAEPTLPTVVEQHRRIHEGGFDELDLTDRAVGDEDAKHLCAQIWETSSVTKLKRLVLQRSGIGLEAVQELGRLLGGGMNGEASPLESLVLSGNDLGPGGITGSFLDGIKHSQNLRSLDLSCCSLLDDGIILLCEVLALRLPVVREVPRLEELSLGCNRLGPAGARTLSACLAKNLKLRALDLKANTLGVEGANILAEGLSANKGRLQKLDISQNEIKHKGAKVLANSFLQKEFSFKVQLERPRGKTTGMTLSQEMTVTNMALSSIIDTWNQEHPSDAVFTGDKIVKINSEEVREEMLEEMRSKEELEFTFTRSGGLQSLDMCYNMITLNGVKELRKYLAVPAAGTTRGWQLSFDEGEREMWLSAH